MIIIKLIGGLGNQLFQYSLGRHLALVHNTVLKLDISGYENDNLRRYALGAFNIQENFAEPEEVSRLIVPKQSALGRIIHGILHNHPKRAKSHIRVKSPCFNPEILELPNNVYLEGYWQSEKYFGPSSETIRRELSLKEEQTGQNRELADMITSNQSLSIHIRRGDYVSDEKTNQTHGICGLDYYHRCLEYFVDRVKDLRLYVFSDDQQWCRENLKLPFPAIYVDHNGPEEDHEDLRLMSQCKHHIIANSSFSWWGAWLNPKQDKIVCAPEKWFAKKGQKSYGIVPDKWIRM